VIRVTLPANLRTLAGVGSVVELEVPGPVTQRSVLDVLEKTIAKSTEQGFVAEADTVAPAMGRSESASSTRPS